MTKHNTLFQHIYKAFYNFTTVFWLIQYFKENQDKSLKETSILSLFKTETLNQFGPDYEQSSAGMANLKEARTGARLRRAN